MARDFFTEKEVVNFLSWLYFNDIELLFLIVEECYREDCSTSSDLAEKLQEYGVIIKGAIGSFIKKIILKSFWFEGEALVNAL